MPFKEPIKKTLRAQWLGVQLRDLRTQRGLTLQEAASYLRYDYSSLGRFERAELPFKREDVVALLDLYEVYDAQDRARLRALSEETWRTDQWDVDFTDSVYDSTFPDYRWLEAQCAAIRLFDSRVLHPLLQNHAYAEAMVRLVEGPKARPEKISEWVGQRMERQEVLHTGRRRLAAVIDEMALRRVIGGPKVMCDQLAHLGALATRPNVDIRILPADSSSPAQVYGAFTLFEMPEPYPEVAFMENLAGRFYLEAPRSQRFAYTYDRLREAALSRPDSAKLIAAAARDWT